jgi:chemotaxis protein methyltransferase CheR
MADAECVAFLQEALPRLGLRWRGFRKVHGQVCKRLRRRMKALGIEGFAAYRQRLDTDPQEWTALDALCHITISRFFRDKSIFEVLERRALPDIAARAGKTSGKRGSGRPDAPRAKSHTRSRSFGIWR